MKTIFRNWSLLNPYRELFLLAILILVIMQCLIRLIRIHDSYSWFAGIGGIGLWYIWFCICKLYAQNQSLESENELLKKKRIEKTIEDLLTKSD
jgi:uncharacterized membrane protein YqjE